MNGLTLFKYKNSILIFHKSLSELRGSQPLWVPYSHTPTLYGRVTFSGPPAFPFGLWLLFATVIDPPKSFAHPSLGIVYSSDANTNWRGSRHSRSDFSLNTDFNPVKPCFSFLCLTLPPCGIVRCLLTFIPGFILTSYSLLCVLIQHNRKKRKSLDNMTSFIWLLLVS